tara:strand:+ start:669 stop:1046 length:378 start_codon:yes stop_codon:yes gene_type:complete
MAFKMKSNPMQRNFGVGSPTLKTADSKKKGDPKTVDPQEKMTQEEKDAAMANAMDAATVEGGLSKETMAASKKHFGGVNPSIDKVNSKIKEYESILNRTGLPESSYNKYKTLLAEARKTAKALGR